MSSLKRQKADGTWEYLQTSGGGISGDELDKLKVFIKQDIFTATEGQTLFVLSDSYHLRQHKLFVSVGGVSQFSPENFTEITDESFMLSEGVPADTKVIATYFSALSPISTDVEGIIDTIIMDIGTLSNLKTANKDNLVDAINELFDKEVEIDITELATKQELKDVEDKIDGIQESFEQLEEDVTEQLNSQEAKINSTQKHNTNQDKEIAWLKLKQEASDRIEGGTNFADDMSGNSFGIKLKNKRAKTVDILSAGNTVLSGHITAIENGEFKLGDSVTILDDINSEIVDITRSEIVQEEDLVEVKDATVIDQPYSASGNGGRKLTMLANGWLVAVVKTATQFDFLVDKRDGEGWNPLCFVDDANRLAGRDIAIVSKGTHVHAIFGRSTTHVTPVGFDVLTVQNTNIYDGTKLVDSGQTAIGNVSLAIDEEKNELHAAWASKNSSYPNSFNIRYSKGTISDGSVTWGAVEQVTKLNNGNNYLNPAIIVRYNQPSIIFEAPSSHNHIAFVTKGYSDQNFSGTSIDKLWGNISIYNGVSYAQSSPSAVVDKDGTIHVAWHGADAVDTATNNIRFSRSTDGGATWSPMEKLTSGNTTNRSNASITVNKENKIFIVYEKKYTVSMIKWENSWGTEVDIIIGHGRDVGAYPSTLVDSTLDFSLPLFIYSASTKVGFSGKWTTVKDTFYLECSPLVNSYKKGALIAETTMNDDGTFPSWEGNSELIEVKDIVVTNQSYSTAGNGGRKLVRLDNGWLVVVTKMTDRFDFFVDKQDGVGWEPLCHISNSNIDDSDIAIASKGTTVYAVSTWKNSLIHARYFDAITVQNINLYSAGVSLNDMSTDTAQGNISLAINKEGTELHTAWSSKNSTLPNSFNIRYSKGTISQSDGSVTWAAVEQRTAWSSTGLDFLNPTVVVNSSGNPLIILERRINGSHGIRRVVFNGTSWTPNNGDTPMILYDGGSYTQSSPSAVVDTDGVIHVAWHGADSATAVTNIRYSKSTNGGATWSPMEKLTSTTSYNQQFPSITTDKNNKIFILFQEASTAIIKSITLEKGEWSPIKEISSSRFLNPSTLHDPTFTVTFGEYPPMIYEDQTGGSVKYTGTQAVEVLTPLTSATASFSLPSTDYVGAFVKKSGATKVEAYINNIKMDSNLDGDEYLFDGNLPSISPVTLRLELNRDSTDGGDNDRITRILGGYA